MAYEQILYEKTGQDRKAVDAFKEIMGMQV